MRALTPEDFVHTHTRLVSLPGVPGVRLHLADDAFDLWEKVEEEVGRVGLPPPFWAFAWAGGQALARYVLDHAEVVAGRRVLDLASGSGLAAIAAAQAGAAAVTACDIDRFAIAAIAANATANGVMILSTDEDVLDGDGHDAEVVFAGDVFYDKTMADRVLPFLCRTRARGARVLVGDPGRAYLPRPWLEALATYEVPVPRALEDTDIKRTTVWRLK